ncbi:hypothetical protein SLS60_006976 [Paraconiothyrium brasiliense]|uniref:Uncharacterized protein n=1 Tax=Paraconiothyrium brasiliense TaxID=300254 RepID=A0ABR3R827_9PLEO
MALLPWKDPSWKDEVQQATFEHPICGECTRKSTLCRYPELELGLSKHELQEQLEDLKRRVTTLEKFLGMLKTAPRERAVSMLEHVRAGRHMDHLLNNFTGADLLLQLSVVPETGRRYDFPYAKSMPLHLLFEGNPYLDSFVYEATFPQTPPSTARLEKAMDGIDGMNGMDGMDGMNGAHRRYPITFSQDAYDKPFQAAAMADPMLDKIDVSKWTSVSSDNRILRKYLGSYFLTPSVLSPVFHKDLFFEDMISGETRFASKLLVNAVLAAGCVSQVRH